jgi:hypothetical protein
MKPVGYRWDLDEHYGVRIVKAVLLEVLEKEDEWEKVDLSRSLTKGIYLALPEDEANLGRVMKVQLLFSPVLSRSDNMTIEGTAVKTSVVEG